MENTGRHIGAKFDLASQLIDKLGVPPEPDEGSPMLSDNISNGVATQEAGAPDANTSEIALRVELDAVRARFRVRECVF